MFPISSGLSWQGNVGRVLASCHRDRVADERTVTFQRIIIKENLSCDLDLRILAFETRILEIIVAHV